MLGRVSRSCRALPSLAGVVMAMSSASPVLAQAQTEAQAEPEKPLPLVLPQPEGLRLDRGIAEVDAALKRMDDAQPSERRPSRAREATVLPGATVLSRSRPGYQPVGIKAGGFTIFPVLAPRVEFDSNIYRSPQPVSDFSFVPAGRIQARSDWSRHQMQVEMAAEQRLYATRTNENIFLYDLSAGGRIDIHGRSSIRLGAERSRRTASRSAAGELPNIFEPIRFDFTRGTIAGTWQTGRLGVTLNGEASRSNFFASRDFAGNPVDQDYRDVDRLVGGLTLGYDTSPRSTIFATFEIEDRDFDETLAALNRDAQAYEARIGLRGAITSLIRGRIAMGFHKESYREPTVNDFNFLVVDAEIEWLASELTTVTLTADRRVGNPASLTSPAYLATRVGVRADHELLRNLILDVELQFEHADFRQSPRTDTFVVAQAGSRWLLNNQLSANLDFRYARRDNRNAGTGGREFTEFSSTIGVSFAF